MLRIAGLLLAGLAGVARADTITYLAYEAWGKTWHDADKAFDGQDENLCWAAAASNVLSYNEWSDTGVPAAQSEDEIFQEFKDHWENEGGSVRPAWEWWMYGDDPISPDPDIDVQGGGGFWPDARFSDHYVGFAGGWDANHYWSRVPLMSYADAYLHMGSGATLGVKKFDWITGHSLTLWGFDYDTDLRTYTRIYYTDSDDHLERLASVPIFLGYWQYTPTGLEPPAWYLNGGDYVGFEVLNVSLLGRAPAPIPEPATFLLLGGAAALAGAFRAARRKREPA